MSGSKPKGKAPAPPDTDRIAERNPGVDVGQLKEAQDLLKELRTQGVSGPEYDISSPYENRPLRGRDPTSS